MSPLLLGLLDASATADPPTAVRTRQDAERLFRSGDLPLIFVGRIIKADLSLHPCRATCGTRLATFSVKRLVFGFSPGDTVTLAYDTGSPPPLFSSTSDLLVFAVGGYGGNWKGSGFLLRDATSENVQLATRVAESHMAHQIEQFKSHHTTWEKLVFLGTVTELWQEPKKQGQPCKQARPFPVVFKLERVVWGGWADTHTTVVFGDCLPPPDPPIRIGRKMIVMAGVVNGVSVIGYLKDVLPDNEIAPVTKHFQQMGLHSPHQD